jgi:hypothetical protein
MQASSPQQPRGSFARPPEPKRAPEQQEPVPAVKTADAADTSAPATSEEDRIQKELDERQKQITKFREEIEQELEFNLNSQDIKDYLFKGRLSKEMVLVPNLMKGVITTLKAADLQEIDLRMSQIKNEAKFTSSGLENENAIVTLSYAWTHADGKSLGADSDEREKRIRQMGALFVERAARARMNFDTLLRLMMQEKDILKK